MFLDSIGEERLPLFVNAVYDASVTAHREVNASWPGPDSEKVEYFESRHARWMYAATRKAHLDRLLLAAGSRAGLVASTQWNQNHSCPHTLLIGGSMLLTAHFVNGRDQLVRDATYRKTYWSNPGVQLSMRFSEDDEDPNAVFTPHIDDPGYAFLIYGESTKPWLPGFIDIVFPTDECRAYHGNRLQLMERLPNLVTQRTGIAGNVEQIPDQPLKLKTPPKEA
jgi:hypothetical protein